jgi:hypothetical protein
MPTPLARGPHNAGQLEDRRRAELAAVLASDIFKRSPQLSRLLLYLCEKCFTGTAGEISEYGIGLDVLGRDPGFDPQQDALVRVNALHLRKRLKEYYATTGRDHEIQIVLPSGCYAPQFVGRPESVPSEEEDRMGAEAPSGKPPAAVESKSPKVTTLRLAWMAGALALLFLAGWWFVAAGRERAGRRVAAANPGRSPAVSWEAAAIRIAAGDRSDDYQDRLGRIWMSDRFFRGGTTFRRGALQIQRTWEPELFQGGREGQFVYDIPLSPGTYELHLYFAETGVATESLRSVSIAINGVPAPAFDVASDAGAVNTATVKIFKDILPAKDGFLHLTFLGTGMGTSPSFLNALEILPGTPGKMLPIRLSTRDSIYRDHLGQIWMPDECSVGGRKSTNPARVQGAVDPGLYETYRFGHFSYSIPVIEGSRYTVRLHFTESWFAHVTPGSGIGNRVFDLYCNGQTLLKDFDILKEAGGGLRAAVRVFHGIPASPQGKLDLTFVPVVNYALVNAIEVFEE